MESETTINKWKRKADELKLQLHLGSRELTDKFEEQKKEIARWSEETRHKLSDESSERATALKTKLEELEVQAALGRAESKQALEEQRKKMSAALREAKEEAEKISSDAKTKVKEIAENTNTTLDTWHMKFDILRLQLKLGAAEASSEWEERKKELSKSINNLENKMKEAGKKSGESWDNFKSEMSEAWGHFRKAFSKN